MAEICSNELYFYCEDENIINIVEDRLNSEECGIFADIYNVDTDIIEAYFDSKWDFPKEKFDIILKDIKSGYFRCISQELCNGYLAVHVWKDGNWIQEEQIDIK